MSTSKVTLDDLVARQRERLASQGVTLKPRTAEIALLQIVAHVGELASVVHRSSPLTTFEREEVARILGSLVVGVATVGDVFGVDVGDAAVQSINQQMTRVDFRSSGPVRDERLPNTTPPSVSDQRAAIEADQARQVLLSPATRRNFFPTLDVVSKFSREQFATLQMTWTAPKADGEMVEVIPGGKQKSLTYDDLPAYLQSVAPLRMEHQILEDAPPALQGLPSSVAAAAATNGVVVRHVDVPQPPGYNADQVKTLFSPTHFDHGLFSPHSVAKALDVPYPTEADAAPDAPDTDIYRPPSTPKEFFAIVDDIAKGNISGDALGSLQLTFSMPIDQNRVIEFIPNGAQVPVSAVNAKEFVRQAYESLKNHHQGKVRRTESIKRLQTTNPGPQYDATADKEKFSPTHFSKDIFAPFTDRTKFYVDYDPSREEDCLPEALRAPRQSGIQEYQEYLRTRGAEGFRGVIQQIERKPSDVKRIGVTWCIPKAVQPSLFPDTEGDELYDLLPNGRDLPVEVEFITVFLGMAHKYL